jgi:1-acyl-sn-glycerol-3-phosphate acyltransferase
MIRTAFLALFFSLAVLLVLPFLWLWTVATGNPELMYGAAMAAVRFAVHLVGIRVRLEGLENIPPQTCIFIANHVSNLDPLALIPRIPRRVGVLIKHNVFRVPILGAGMRLAKFIPVDRGDRESAGTTVPTVTQNLREGRSYAIFGEGTRSPDGRLRPFRKGAFTMAIDARAWIVPVAIAGTMNLMKKGDWAIRPGEVCIRFGQAIDASLYSSQRRAELIARVESEIALGLPPEQRPHAGRAGGERPPPE